MKTNLRFIILGIAALSTAGSMSAQQLFLRADAGAAAAHSGPFDSGAGEFTFYTGCTLDEAGKQEVSASLGVIAWSESRLGHRHINDAAGTTSIRMAGDEYALPSGNRDFSFDNDRMVIGNGSSFKTDYHPELSIVPFMANYRYNFGVPEDRLRFFAGGGAGLAFMQMRTRLPGRFSHDWSSHYNDDSKTSFTWNAQAGVSILVSRRVSIDVSYAFQQFQGATFHMDGVSYKLSDMNVSMGRAGATVRF